MTHDTFFATAPKGMVDLLARELSQMGASPVKESRGGVHFSGDLETAYRACLWSRLANRILLPLADFAAPSTDALYQGVKAINWSAHLSAEQTIAVDTNLSNSGITHSHFASLRVKDAIVDYFQESQGLRPNVDLDAPDIRINCYISADQASLYLDLSGTSLHQRNYRLDAGRAPLKENLAAAILLRSRWHETADAQGAFIDLMCGSGTLVIEAALMAADIAPGLTRQHWGFDNWQQHRQSIWQRLTAEAQYRRDKGLKGLPVILGFDNNRRVLEQARSNADRVGLSHKIQFVYQDIFAFCHDLPSHGLMVSNPPYGKRLSESGELPALYKALGTLTKTQLVGWKAAIFTENPALGKHMGLRAEKLHTLYNGALACKLIQFDVDKSRFYRDDRLPRILEPDEISPQAVMFRNRLTKNLKQISRWARKSGITCYRTFDADLPDYAAAIDVYQGADDQTEKWVCIQEYEAPASIDPGKAKFRTQELVTVCKAIFNVNDEQLFYKTRTRQRGDSQYERKNTSHEFHQVREATAKLWVNFEDYLDTGIFLDHRPLRQILKKQAAGKTFLNLFSYTGVASVQAALGGATKTTSVDMSRTYLDWAKRNLRLNNLSTDQHELVQANCLKWLTQQKPASYDLILVDPPSFSNSKRMDQAFNVAEDHADLLRNSIRLLRPGGTLYFSTNLRKFKLDHRIQDEFNVIDISAETIPVDFSRRRNIHQCWQLSR
ncbi:MAG: bifunctional 23S rRNA (guanine(2069)-N(7))-methyltransferase RlmK/23S rRNA (guanine(2445)-N(2))-methyltransferase RlmL [Pseudomonadales bacterium]|nr:bifunctional 23S rRNA (guanine(2069)-N(7))-methyltransferase RlmK/23S rRNA (guanine(2445)-N(2))-methyltransferase RlmL [Pseudomonadales bacterium]